MHARVFGLLALAICAAVGCSDDDDDSSAQDRCVALAEATCERLVSCAGELTGEDLGDADQADCVDSVRAESECSRAVATGPGYNECISIIRDASCEDVWSVDADGDLELNELPEVCEGVIQTQ